MRSRQRVEDPIVVEITDVVETGAEPVNPEEGTMEQINIVVESVVEEAKKARKPRARKASPAIEEVKPMSSEQLFPTDEEILAAATDTLALCQLAAFYGDHVKFLYPLPVVDGKPAVMIERDVFFFRFALSRDGQVCMIGADLNYKSGNSKSKNQSRQFKPDDMPKVRYVKTEIGAGITTLAQKHTNVWRRIYYQVYNQPVKNHSAVVLFPDNSSLNFYRTWKAVPQFTANPESAFNDAGWQMLPCVEVVQQQIFAADRWAKK